MRYVLPYFSLWGIELLHEFWASGFSTVYIRTAWANATFNWLVFVLTRAVSRKLPKALSEVVSPLIFVFGSAIIYVTVADDINLSQNVAGFLVVDSGSLTVVGHYWLFTYLSAAYLVARLSELLAARLQQSRKKTPR